MRTQTVTISSSSVIDTQMGQIMVLVDTASLNWTPGGLLYLPLNPPEGVQVIVKDKGGFALSKSIIVDGVGFLIDTDATWPLQVAYASLVLVCNGSKWVVL